MDALQNILVLDAGNTRVKIGAFSNGELIASDSVANEDIHTLLDLYPGFKMVVSSVRSDTETQAILETLEATLIHASANLPFASKYKSPTLGMDRLCNTMYLHSRAKTRYAACIDLGTCIKFDLYDKEVGYLGGSISPGINLRYKSLHDHTGKLPLLSKTHPEQLIGNTTEQSIESGVIRGIQYELDGFVNQYESQFPGLTFFVTGGDAAHFDIHSKNDIFAVENLTLIGIYELYLFNI